MLFKDHLKLVTDAGAVLHLGWDYDAPYNLDPLNGVDVDIQTAQGVNQTGTTVERQSVGGVSRTLSVVFWGSHALDNARRFAQKLPYYTTGTMYFGDAYFTRFVVQKTPYFSSYTEPRCSLMLYSPKPYWYGLTATASVLGGYQPAFTFPVCYDSHIYGIKRDGEAAVLRNDGSLPVPFTATLRCSMPVVHPRVVDLKTGAFIGFDLTLEDGDTLEIYRSTTDRLACTLTRAGKTENIFSKLDEDSTLTELQPGDNVLSMQADSGAVFDYCQTIGRACDLGFRVILDGTGADKHLLFECFRPTFDPNHRFAPQWGNLLNAGWSFADTDYANVALVQGAGEGDARATVWVGDVDSTGSDRREMYIDARDIQPDEDSGETNTSQSYLQKLADRGGEKLLGQLRTGSVEFSVEDDSLQVGDVLRVSLPQLGYTAMVRVADIITESQDSGTTRTLRLGTPTWHKT